MDMKVLVKDGVVFKEINEPALLLFKVLMEVGASIDSPRVITSANDGVHHGDGSGNSLHYKNLAWDIRSHDLTQHEKWMVLQYLHRELSDDWDVILEGEGTTQEHFHAEFDPK